MGDKTGSLMPDLGTGGAIVRIGVGSVRVLVQHFEFWLVPDFVSPGNGAFGCPWSRT